MAPKILKMFLKIFRMIDMNPAYPAAQKDVGKIDNDSPLRPVSGTRKLGNNHVVIWERFSKDQGPRPGMKEEPQKYISSKKRFYKVCLRYRQIVWFEFSPPTSIAII